MEMRILDKSVSLAEAEEMAKGWFGVLIKGCVDVASEKVALGGDYHMETCELLTSVGSDQNNVWGFNVRFDSEPKGLVELTSLVNIKPSQGNRSMEVENEEVAKAARKIISEWIING